MFPKEMLQNLKFSDAAIDNRGEGERRQSSNFFVQF